MKIYTTYFANVKNLPKNVIPIAICSKAPDSWKGLQYKRLAPKWEFFKIWKETHDNDFYIREFTSKVTGKLNACSVMRELISMVPSGYDIALVCYEKPGDFCHRHLVAEWLTSVGYVTEEYK